MSWLSNMGAVVQAKWHAQRYVAAVVWAVVGRALRPAAWPRTVRNVFARQLLFTGYEASRFVALLALAVGVSVVVQAQVWLAKLGQSALLGPVLVMVVVRELGPLLVNFVIIGRSGTAMVTEMGSMQIAGEVRVLDAQGLDPFGYLVLPRVLGAALSIFCLTVLFIAAAFLSGYVSGLLLGANPGTPAQFADTILRTIQPQDVFCLLAKTLLPGAVTGAICCIEGLSVHAAITEVPQAATRAVVRSAVALFLISALISLVTYL